MSRRDDTVPMRHMLDHAREALVLIRGRTRRDLDDDRLFQLAMTRLVEIIGEAASRVTAQGHAKYPDVPWQKVINTRHRIVHGYDAVNHDVVWQILTVEIPVLIGLLERALPGHQS